MNYLVGELYRQPEPTIIAAVTQEAAKVIFFSFEEGKSMA